MPTNRVPTQQGERKRGRPRTGSWRRLPDGRIRLEITLPTRLGGGRTSHIVADSESMTDERAGDLARHFNDNPDELFTPEELAALAAAGRAEPRGETVLHYAERWTEERVRRGLATAKEGLGALRHWLPEALATKPLASVTQADARAFVAHLDANVQTGDSSWKTALNVWGLFTKLFDDATNGKVDTLRVLASSPTTGVRGPDRGMRKSKTYLLPSELLALVQCERIPLADRRLVAIAAYTGLRASELRGLTWDDVELASGVVTVHHAVLRDGTETSTKTERARRFALEQTLLPLLRAMRQETGGEGRVVRLGGERDLARSLRSMLRRARIDRPELQQASPTRKPLTWHDLRATAGTWWAVRGDSAPVIQDRLGHTNYAMTQRYVREAAIIREGFGEPFPELPKCLIDGPEKGFSRTILRTGPLSPWNCSGEAGIRTRGAGPDARESQGNSATSPEPSPATGDDNPAIAGAERKTCAESPELSGDVVAALAVALERASAAGEWGVVAALARELEARRLEAAGVPSLPASKRTAR